jgi:3-deoxy-D-manno-octulosonic-acid transferase
MYLLYSLFLMTWGMLLIPVFLYRAWRHHKHLPGLGQRLGRLPESLKFDGRSTLWFHACSVGEALSLQPLVQALHSRFPKAKFAFSTITQTGQLVAARNFAKYGSGNTFYFPVDLASVVKRVLNWIRPAAIVIIDTEIWPNLIHQAHLRGIPVVLANGRISAASFRYYRHARPVLRRVLRQYRMLLMASREDAQRIITMGAPSEKILVTGNLKFDKSLVENENNDKDARALQSGLGLGREDAPLIVAGSTHSGEEQILLEVLQRVRRIPELNRTRLLLAPRHPERFDEAAEVIAQNGFKVRRRTESSDSDDSEVLLLDSLGELAAAYRFATIAFVGGTLIRRGGHSIMEPAAYSKAIVIGPSVENFRGIVEEFLRHGGVRQISAEQEDRKLQVEQLTDVFVKLLQNRQEREALGKTAFSILEKNRGATRLTAEQIAATFAEMQNQRRMVSPHPES